MCSSDLGQYHSAFKGRGMAFSEVREYQFGDDIRDIDWNVTARQGSPHIKIFEEEREMTVMLLIDVSGSREFGTISKTKQEMITEIAATLAFSAIQNNDKIGVIFFSDKIEKYIPPQKGKRHVLAIISELINFKPSQKGTDVKKVIDYITNAQKKRCTAFLISDFVDCGDFENSLTIANKKHDIVALQVYDKREKELPPVGLMKMQDAETGQQIWIDTFPKKVRNEYSKWWNTNQENITKIFNKSRTDTVSIATVEDFVPALLSLFKKRVN